MIIQPIAKAKYLFDGGNVYLMFSDERKAIFHVGEDVLKNFKVTRLEYEEGSLRFSCSCEYMGSKGIRELRTANKGICSHITACILWTAMKKGRIEKV